MDKIVKNRFKKIGFFFVSIFTFLYFIKGKFVEIYSSDSMFYLYIFFKMFYIEIMLFVLVVYFLDSIKSNMKGFYRMLFYSNKTYKENLNNKPIYSLFMICVLFSVFLSGYTIYKIAIGKYIFLNNYYVFLIKSAEDSFKKGDYITSKKYLNSCVFILHSNSCKRMINALNSRMKEAENILRLYDKIDRNNIYARIKILRDILYLDKNKKFYSSEINEIRKRFDIAKKIYSKSLINIKKLNIEESIHLLNDVNNNIAFYSATPILIKELKSLKSDYSIMRHKHPYLYALKKDGVEKFIKLTRHSFYTLYDKPINEYDMYDGVYAGDAKEIFEELKFSY